MHKKHSFLRTRSPFNILRTFVYTYNYGCVLWNISSKYSEEMQTERFGHYILVLIIICNILALLTHYLEKVSFFHL